MIAHRLGSLEAEARRAFVARYVTEDGRLTSDSRTAYAIALVFDLLDGDALEVARRRLRELVEEEGHRIGTGFAGTRSSPTPCASPAPSTPPTCCSSRPSCRRGCIP